MSPNYVQPADPIGAGLNAFNAVQNMGARNAQNALTQMQLRKAQEREAALKQYGQDRDVEALWKASPETAMAAEKFVAGLKTEKQQALLNDIKIFDNRKALYLDNPEAYAEDYKNVDKDFQKSLYPPDKFAALTPEQRKGVLFAKEKITATLKQALVPIINAQGAIVGYSQGRPVQLKQSPEEAMRQKKELEDYRQGNREKLQRMRETEEDTEHPGFRVPKSKGAVTFITPEEAKANPGKQWPKGTRLIKEDDPEWKAAGSQANRIVSQDISMMNATPGQIAQRQAQVQKEIYTAGKQERAKIGKGGDSSTPPTQYLKEGQQTTFKNGQTWTLRNGKAVRIK